MSDDPAEQAILDALADGGRTSISPTDAARRLAGFPPDESWRKQLAPVKRAAQRLARAGRIEILRKGKPVPPDILHGVIRLRLSQNEE